MNLDQLKGRPNPEPPELIKNVGNSYSKEGEKMNVFPQRVLYNSEKYYYVTYYYKSLEEKAAGILIVKEDGSVPLHKDVIVILNYITTIEAAIQNVFTYGVEWSERPMKIWKKLQSILESFSEIVNASKDRSFKKNFETFNSIPQVMFDTQADLKKVIEKMKDCYRELSTDYLVTKELYEKFDQTHLHMMKIMKKQFEVQIETEKERTQFMKKLKKEIPLTDAHNWFLYLQLLKWHKWLNADTATMAEYEKFKADVSREKATEQTRKELIDSIRNPRG